MNNGANGVASTIPADNNIAITLRGVHKHFGALRAVDGIDLDIHKGQIFGLIGHNGAGKSTLFKMMLGLETPTQGEILIDGASVMGRDFRSTRRSIGYLPENVVLYDNLDGLETLQFFARLKGAPLSQCAPMLERVGLGHAGKRPVREYSKGMRQRLGFAQSLLGSPKVLFLDEPTNGLDPQAIREFYTILRELQSTGVTIIITSHILAELQERVDRLAILVSGQLQAVGSVQELREHIGLPLVVKIEIDDASAAEAIHNTLRAVTQASIERTETGLHLQCPRADKMAVVGALAPFGGTMRDLHLLEPSLEDMFFGFSN